MHYSTAGVRNVCRTLRVRSAESRERAIHPFELTSATAGEVTSSLGKDRATALRGELPDLPVGFGKGAGFSRQGTAVVAVEHDGSKSRRKIVETAPDRAPAVRLGVSHRLISAGDQMSPPGERVVRG